MDLFFRVLNTCNRLKKSNANPILQKIGEIHSTVTYFPTIDSLVKVEDFDYRTEIQRAPITRKSWIRKSWKENWCSQGGRVGLVPLCPNSTHRCDYLAQVESWKRPRFARDPRRGTDATDAFQWDACHHARAGPFTCNRSRRSATYARIPPVARVILCSTVWRRSMIKGIDTRVCVSRLKNN